MDSSLDEVILSDNSKIILIFLVNFILFSQPFLNTLLQ